MFNSVIGLVCFFSNGLVHISIYFLIFWIPAGFIVPVLFFSVIFPRFLLVIILLVLPSVKAGDLLFEVKCGNPNCISYTH